MSLLMMTTTSQTHECDNFRSSNCNRYTLTIFTSSWCFLKSWKRGLSSMNLTWRLTPSSKLCYFFFFFLHHHLKHTSDISDSLQVHHCNKSNRDILQTNCNSNGRPVIKTSRITSWFVLLFLLLYNLAVRKKQRSALRQVGDLIDVDGERHFDVDCVV